MKHHSLAVDFSNLDFGTMDIEILANKAKEQEEVAAIGGTDAAITEGTDLGQRGETVTPSTYYNLPYFPNIGCLSVLRPL